ncbi:NAD(P)/FAD-dependent oxidoreductase [Pseudonocardia kunmingensis]|uniref:Putative NAD/FAD-binding protein n=1 Tax=Pseudonocardia kunmingensis TaxID=630975 RepID=A0A543DYN9_9PSEU|nr:FAD-dependent oxidoreductase [Pseudonocardia kunmingensis]TQM14445.1 putative NAD/FAD-binding protein [Pseudonocardia kunmingensis]
MTSRPTAAVIGAGVAGLTAAHLLQRRYDVTLFEADHRLGGHAHTHEVVSSDGGTARVDSGFIVHNERTYPTLLRLFAELGVATQESDMSMSVRCEGCGLEYAGGRRLGGLFPQASNLARPAYLRMLAEVLRFHRHARRVLADERAGDVTLGAFLAIGGYSRYFVEHFVLPVVSAVWSAGETVSSAYPARYLFTFLHHHGLLAVGGSPRWRTVVGGSQRYVERVVKDLTAVHVATPVRAVRRAGDGAEVRDGAGGAHRVDRVVVATHPDQALALLAEPTAAQREVLGAFTYSRNTTWLHSDTGVLPRRPRARASWNYLKPSCSSTDAPVLVSYDVNRLQRLVEPDDYVVTLGGQQRVDPERVIARMVYEHPVYTPESVAAQRRLPALNDGVLAFAGAYHGWGFHEDGAAAGVRAAESLGAGW